MCFDCGGECLGDGEYGGNMNYSEISKKIVKKLKGIENLLNTFEKNEGSGYWFINDEKNNFNYIGNTERHNWAVRLFAEKKSLKNDEQSDKITEELNKNIDESFYLENFTKKERELERNANNSFKKIFLETKLSKFKKNKIYALDISSEGSTSKKTHSTIVIFGVINDKLIIYENESSDKVKKRRQNEGIKTVGEEIKDFFEKKAKVEVEFNQVEFFKQNGAFECSYSSVAFLYLVENIFSQCKNNVKKCFEELRKLNQQKNIKNNLSFDNINNFIGKIKYRKNKNFFSES